MPSYLDLGVIAIVLISAVLAMVRGFTREVLAIASWAAAAIAAIYFHPYVLPYVKPYISKDAVALAVSAAIVFFVTLIIVSVITVKISDAILDSKVGPLDRSLGFVFGAVRGVLLCVIAFVFFNWLVPQKAQPEWVKDARMRPMLQSTGDGLIAMLPDDPEGLLNRLRKPKAASEEAVPDTDMGVPPANAAPASNPTAGSNATVAPSAAPSAPPIAAPAAPTAPAPAATPPTPPAPPPN
ncbi:MAG: CvpA family protein [Methylovirgula sp.]|jgi:membrane protein required for colicin V production